LNFRLRPELEKRIEEDIQRSPYQSVDEFVERLFPCCCTSRKCGSQAQRTEIEAKIDAGYAASQRGELLDSDSVRRLMDERKTSWLSEHRKA
jgi:hypothetical protein